MRRTQPPRDTWSTLFGPVPLQDPRFYDLSQRMALVVSLAEGEGLLIDKERCRVRKHHHEETPANVSFHILGAVVIMDARVTGEAWIDFRRFVPDMRLGKVAILREEFNLERVVEAIARDAEDLSDPDLDSYLSGHMSLCGRLVEAIGLLMNGLRSGEQNVRERAAEALYDLFDHLGHHCYDLDERRILRAAAESLAKEASSEPDPDVRRAIDRAIDSFQEKKAAGLCDVVRTEREGP